MHSIKHVDLGTPSPHPYSPAEDQSGPQVTLQIDGVPVTVPEGTSLMRAAAIAGRSVPKLCATDTLKAFGSCRLCLVEIEGRRGYPASCTTLAAEGLVVRTESPKLTALRRNVVELYVSDHPLECVSCAANGNCELQDVAAALDVTTSRYGIADGKGSAPAAPLAHGTNGKGSNGNGSNGHGLSGLVGLAAIAGHQHLAQDTSNPYFTFDPSMCIVCSRCVRACDEVQGTFALTISGRGFESKVAASQDQPFLDSECVSCGACVEACPTVALSEKTLIETGPAERAVTTTCAYCGVGCSFNAEMRGDEVVRMAPNRDGHANHGHACVKGRFAFGYATHPDRITTPMIRRTINDPWESVSWEKAISHAASEFRCIQKRYGRDAIGGITSSRCTNEETFLVQKLVRAAFGNNNVDTCARVCHSPTGYGLKSTIGESAGTQAFDSVMKADVLIVVGANPTDGHPVFASQLKRRLRQGAKLIVIDPREIALVRSPHIEADYHLPVRPGTNVALFNALSHVIVTEGLTKKGYVDARCETDSYAKWEKFVAEERNSPEATAEVTGVDPGDLRAAARLYASAPNGAIYYGLGVTEHSQGSTMVMAIANLAMATGNLGREGVGVNPLRGQNNVQGSCDMGSFPHEFSGYRHVSDKATRELFEGAWGVPLLGEPGLRIPNMFEAALDGSFLGMYIQGEDPAQSDPDTQHVTAALAAMECVVIQDLFLNETAKYAHVFLPGASFLEKDGTFTNAERRISRVRKVMPPRAGLADWEVTVRLANALGYPMHYDHPSQIMDEIAALTPTFTGVSYEKLDRLGSIQWPCNEKSPEGTPTMHVGEFVRGKGKFFVTEFVPTSERSTRKYPLLLTTGRKLSQYNVGAQTRRTANVAWAGADVLEIHPSDAEVRGISDGDTVGLSSRSGDIVLPAEVTDRVRPGVVYTTFHFPESGANVVTTENSDWATNCPEYKVTAVEVIKVGQPSLWQMRHRAFTERQEELLRERDAVLV